MRVETPLAGGAEFDVIRAILEGAAPHDAVVGPGDDAAVLRGGMVVSTDVAVEGSHFRRGWLSPEEAGGRAVRAALSDLAAMGARPVGVFSTLSGPERERMVGAGIGVRRGAEAFGARLLGGNVARADGPLTIAVTVVGDLAGCPPWCRSGARAGDALWVTGELGAAAAAVAIWTDGGEPDAGLRERFVRPVPRFEVVDALRGHLDPTAVIDLSDGVASDARHLATASGVRIVVEAERLPVATGVAEGRSGGEALRLALAGGEDYELLLAGAPSEGVEVTVEAATGVPLTRIGRVEEGEGAVLETPGGELRPLDGGFTHWPSP